MKTREKLLQARDLIDESINDLDELEELLSNVELPIIPPPAPPPPELANRWLDALNALEPDNPTGAWGRMSGGRQGSQTEVDYNWSRLTDEYKSNLNTVANEIGIPASVLCGISGRESNHGYSLDSNGCGDHGYGFGCLQVDKRYHDVQGKPDPYSMEHLRQSGGIFIDYLSQIEGNHPDWEDKYLLKGAMVAYNSGVSNVQSIEGMDRGTTGNDYGADTAARAQMYLEKGIV